MLTLKEMQEFDLLSPCRKSHTALSLVGRHLGRFRNPLKTCPVLEEIGSGSGCAALRPLISHSHDTAFERNLL